MPPKIVTKAATPRQIRRAFGANALEAINSHADAIEDVTAQVTRLTALLARGWLGRLTWLVTGR